MLPGDDGAGEGGFAGEFAVDVGFAFHAALTGAEGEDVDFKAELVAGGDGSAEFSAFDAGEDDEFLFAVGDFGEEEDATGLCHSFDDEDAGHDGVAGKVSIEEFFVNGDVFDGHDAFSGVELHDPIDEEERVAMGQEFHNLPDVHGLVFRRHAVLPWRNGALVAQVGIINGRLLLAGFWGDEIAGGLDMRNKMR